MGIVGVWRAVAAERGDTQNVCQNVGTRPHAAVAVGGRDTLDRRRTACQSSTIGTDVA